MKLGNNPVVTIQELLEAGVHLGHKAARRNPKMEAYIHGTMNDINIIDLRYTAALITVAAKEIYNVVKKNGKVLFVATKHQARDIVQEYAEKCGQYYINYRWLGGTLTNWSTVSQRIKTLDQLDKILANEEDKVNYKKKELLALSRIRGKLQRSLGGIKNMGGKPDLIVIVDTNKEHLALKEAKKLNIPVVAILDTNSDPDGVLYPVPGNDDAIKSIDLYCRVFCDAALLGIQDALVASGVDIGALAGEAKSDKFAAAKKVSKMKFSKRVTNTGGADLGENKEQEFLSELNKTKA